MAGDAPKPPISRGSMAELAASPPKPLTDLIKYSDALALHIRRIASLQEAIERGGFMTAVEDALHLHCLVDLQGGEVRRAVALINMHSAEIGGI
ncbi:hypothetical protein [Sphingomonas montanisoli]|uniref:Uncharacterized protein n=1 Tax=Sphingomonas montanisoli TaxID=2606412 RepID=A0A5D9CBQ2_9SPHN|nr:hypothetical protein [Sphingomonas montanisoli]TZG28592.1 hypothetical protein FYJ91_00070 [Sphingomonas montanisoli]